MSQYKHVLIFLLLLVFWSAGMFSWGYFTRKTEIKYAVTESVQIDTVYSVKKDTVKSITTIKKYISMHDTVFVSRDTLKSDNFVVFIEDSISNDTIKREAFAQVECPEITKEITRVDTVIKTVNKSPLIKGFVGIFGGVKTSGIGYNAGVSGSLLINDRFNVNARYDFVNNQTSVGCDFKLQFHK